MFLIKYLTNLTKIGLKINIFLCKLGQAELKGTHGTMNSVICISHGSSKSRVKKHRNLAVKSISIQIRENLINCA